MKSTQLPGLTAARPMAKGHVLITLADGEGLINLIVRPQVYERYKEVLRHPPRCCGPKAAYNARATPSA
jgi:hypothetical protein